MNSIDNHTAPRPQPPPAAHPVATNLALLPLAGRPVLAAVRGAITDGGLQLSAVLFALAVMVIVLWALKRTDHRLFRLSDFAESVDRGDPGARVSERGDDSIARLSRALNRIAQRTETSPTGLEGREQEVLRLAYRDELTGLPNRRLLREILAKEIAHARRGGGKVGIAVLNVEGLRAITDGASKEACDGLLMAVATRLTEEVRESDTLARLGSGEFGLLVTRAPDLGPVVATVARAQESVERPFELLGREVTLSASAGISTWPDSGEDPETLLRRAETALRRAQGQGKGGRLVFSPSMAQRARKKLDLEADLRRALQRDDELTVFLQPQIAVVDGSLIGLEALARWRHPQRGLLPASSFIPLAERAGLMPELGKWVLREICECSARWQRLGVGRIPISVNFSACQFQADSIAALVDHALRSADLDPELLHIEITESIALHDLDRMTEALGSIHDLGVKILLDDFGTGYSSLSYLLRYPVDGIKIDRAFIAGVPGSQHCEAIVRATLALARALKLQVIAEGVETEGQQAFLRSQGCEAAQGFLLGRPAPPERFEGLVQAGRLLEVPGTT